MLENGRAAGIAVKGLPGRLLVHRRTDDTVYRGLWSGWLAMRLERLSRTRRRKGASVYTRSEECHRRKYATESSYRPRILDPTSLGNVHRFRSYSYFLFLSWWSFTGNRYLNTNAAESHGAIGQGNTNRGREERGGLGGDWEHLHRWKEKGIGKCTLLCARWFRIGGKIHQKFIVFERRFLYTFSNDS